MRLDRSLTLFLFRFFYQPGFVAHGGRLPILMYHSVSDDNEEGIHPYYRVSIGPKRFSEQMQWLTQNGYEGVTLSEGIEMLTGRRPTRKQPVAITFDDGFRDFRTNALPILQAYNFRATVFLPTAFIGQKRRVFRTRDCLTWSEIRETHQAGIEFGSHSVSHAKLDSLNWSDIETELRSSKESIETQIDTPVRAFSYPFAFPSAHKRFVSRFRDLLSEAAYDYCVTTQIGCVSSQDDFLVLRRLPLNSADDYALFRAKLKGAYDWMSIPQAWSKTWRRALRSEATALPFTNIGEALNKI